MLAELTRLRERDPDRVAVRVHTPAGPVVTTWAGLHDAVSRVAATGSGLAPGAPVVVSVDASADALATVLGLCAAGVDVIVLEERSSHLADPGSVLRRIGATMAIGPPTTVSDGRAHGQAPPGWTSLSYADCQAGPGGLAVPSRSGDIVSLTSGSTGEPRLVRQPLANLVHGGQIYQRLLGLAGGDTVLAAVPLAHSFGLVGGLFAVLACGGSLATLAPFGPRRLRSALRDGASVLLGTPLVYRLLGPARAGGHLRAALSSGAPLEPWLAERAYRALGVPVRQIYGSTEAGLIAYQPESTSEWPPGVVGLAAPGVELALRPDAEGERLLVRTPTLFTGYVGESAAVADEDGWYPTGDLASIDELGRLRLTGRKRTFVNVGGRKVNPTRIERILSTCDGVREAHVYGHDEAGAGGVRGEQRVHAAVVLAPGTAVADLLGHCRSAGLLPYEVPHRFHVLPRLPRNSMGKIDRVAVLAAAGRAPEAVPDPAPAPGPAAPPWRVSVIGLGYVGLTLAVCLARAGMRVTGVEADAGLRRSLSARRATIFEPGVQELLAELDADQLVVTGSLPPARQDAIVICVGTPIDQATSRPELAHLRAAVDHVVEHLGGPAARGPGRASLVVVRSTVPVGTTRAMVHRRMLEAGAAPLLAFCPERTIQGRALTELARLPQVIGGVDAESVARARELFVAVAPDQVVVSSLEAAELVKLVCNAHTDLIYGFGNEVALMAGALGLDGNEVIASANLRYPRPDLSRPGFVGGGCLTKDPYLLMHAAQEAGYRPPLVAAARAVNERLPYVVADQVLRELVASGRAPDRSRVLVCGIAYKGRPATDDVRGSAAIAVADHLRGRVGELAGHDYLVAPERIAALGYRPVPLPDGMAGADALVLLVDHPRYRQDIDIHRIREHMRAPVVVYDVWGELDALDGHHDLRYRRLGRG